MPLTPWKHLISTGVNSGKFPAGLLPASEIEFSFEYLDSFSGSVFGDDSQVTLEARFEVRDAGENLVLAWGFKITYMIVVFDATWTYYAETQKVTQTYPVPPAPTLGDPNGIAIPGGGGGIGLGDLSFDETFESPIFKVKIPAGSTVKIVFHTASFGSLNDIAQLTVRTLPGAAGLPSGFRHGHDGEAFLLFPGASDWQTVRASGRDRGTTTPLDTTWKPDGAAFVVKSQSDKRQWALYQVGTAVIARHSDNDGKDWSAGVTVYTGYTLLGVCKHGDNGLVALLSDPTGKVYSVGYGDRNENWDAPIAATVPTGTALSAGLLLSSSANSFDFFWVISTGGMGHIISKNDGKDWS